MREKLPNRRMSITETLTFHPGRADEMVFDVSYGFEPGGPVKEFFSKAYKIGASLHGLMHQGCIGFSISLQCGQGMADIARVIGEDNPAEEPQSPFGLAVRAGVELDAYLTAQWAIMNAPRPSNRDVSAGGKPSPKAGPQAQAFHAGTGIGTPAVHDGEREGVSPANVSEGVTGGERAAHLHSIELADGIGIEDLAPEDGGILFAMHETQSLASASITDLRDIPEFLRRTQTAERPQ